MNSIGKEDFKFYYSLEEPYIIEKENYLKNCSNLISFINKEPIQKVVLSRIKKVDHQLNPIEIFEKLNLTSKNTFNYIFSIENVGTWIGATPETLINIENNKANTTSLAGTKPLNDIRWTKKEIEEQKIVTDYIFEVLKKHTKSEIEINGTYTHKTTTVAHLKTDFITTINPLSWKDLIFDIHPTPATCGFPKKSSIKIITEIEKHKRSFYTGFLGPISNSSKNLYVNLRCMEIQKKSAFLYLGGGITKDSNEEHEWEETELKGKTLLSTFK